MFVKIIQMSDRMFISLLVIRGRLVRGGTRLLVRLLVVENWVYHAALGVSVLVEQGTERSVEARPVKASLGRQLRRVQSGEGRCRKWWAAG